MATQAAAADLLLAPIERHKALFILVSIMSDYDEAPAYKAACAEEEAAIQLGDMTPTTVAGAAAQLQYMAVVVTCAAAGSLLLQTVLTIAKALADGVPA